MMQSGFCVSGFDDFSGEMEFVVFACDAAFIGENVLDHTGAAFFAKIKQDVFLGIRVEADLDAGDEGVELAAGTHCNLLVKK